MKINEKHLSYFASCRENPDMEGWLWKKGELNTSYQKRWCILIGNLLFYFEKRLDKEPIGVIVLENSSVQLAEGGDSPYTFSIQFAGEGSRVYKLSADDEISSMKWVRALSNCSYRYLAILVEGLDKEAKLLKAKKELKKQEELKKTVPVYHKQFSEPDVPDSINGNIESRKSFSSNLVKANSLNNILDENLDNYNALDDNFLDFDIFPDEKKKGTQLSKTKSSEAISTLTKSAPSSPKVKKNTKKYDVIKKYSSQVSKKKHAPNSFKNGNESNITSSQSVPIFFSRLSPNSLTLDFPTLHHIYRKDIETFLNQSTV